MGSLAFLLLSFSSDTAAGGPTATGESGYEAYVGPSIDLNDAAARFLPQALAGRPRPPAMAGAKTGEPGADVPLGGWNETTIAVNPNNPQNIACASLYELRVSTDGGTTWQEAVHPRLPATHIQQGDPSLAFDRDGRLFWSYFGSPLGAYISFLGIDVFIAQCDPMTGQILAGYPVNVTEGIGLPGSAGNQHDKGWLAADFHAGSPFANRLYLVWTNFPPTGGTVVLTSHSSDQGLTWSPALVLQPAGGAFNWPSHITVAPSGDVYAAYHRQPGFVGGAPNGVSGSVSLLRSTNGGVTFPQSSQAFTAGQADMTFNRQTFVGTIPGAKFWLQGSVQPWVLVDPNVPGRVYVVANDDPDNNVQAGDAANVMIARSTDHGATWSSPLRVDRGPGSTFQVMPTATIDPVSGAIAVHYYDNRNGAVNAQGNYLLDVFAAVSVDGGSTFYPDFQVNDLGFDPDAGARCRFDCGPFVTDTWASSGDSAYAVTDAGQLILHHGNNWSLAATAGAPLFGVWGSSATDVLMCGPGGQIRNFDGSVLTSQASNTPNDLFGIDGRSGTDIFAVGAIGTVVHYDGKSWSLLESGTLAELFDVWANPAGDVWVVGKQGTVLRYDGVSWSAMSPPGTTEPLSGVWGSSDQDVYVTGGNGGKYHWNGTLWTAIDSQLGLLTGVWGTAATDVIALGFGRIQRFDGNTWASEDLSEHLLWKLHGSGPSNVFAVGEGAFIAHYDGSSWTSQTNPLTPLLPTKRIGEYNGVAAGGGRSYAVWCGNTVAPGTPGAAIVPLDQQAIFDSFETAWQTGISVVDLSSRAPAVVLEHFKPNPARGPAAAAYILPRAEAVDLSLVDVQGRRVATLIHGHQPAGRHVVSWDGKNAAGHRLPAGVYFLRLNAGGETRTERMTLIR